MPRAKTPRNGNPSVKKQVLTMPEADSATATKKTSQGGNSLVDLESQIRQRAYELYQERGCTAGHEHEDWLRAEREVRARQQQSA